MRKQRINSDYPKEQRIQRISRWQFREHLDWKWWLSDLEETDLGEDEIVRIYDDGRFSGIRFLVQLKGTEQPPNKMLVGGGFLKKSVTINNMQSWEISTIPVIFVIWNIVSRKGYWLDINSEVKRLDDENAKWRNNSGNVILHVPLTNEFNNDGFQRLRDILAAYYEPTLLAKKALQRVIEFRYSLSDSEGTELDSALRMFLEHGESATVNTKHISAITHSDWFARLHNLDQPMQLTSGTITLSSYVESDEKRYRLDIVGAEGSIQSAETCFWVEHAGKETYTISNYKDTFPLKLRMRLPRLSSLQPPSEGTIETVTQLSHSLNGFGVDVHETQKLINFLSSLAHGGQLRFIDLSEQQRNFDLDVPPRFFDFQISKACLDVINELCFIQLQSRAKLSVQEIAFTRDEVREIFTVGSLLRGEEINLENQNIGIALSKTKILELAAEMRERYPLHITFERKNQFKQVLGVSVPLGNLLGDIIVVSVLAPSELDKIASSMGEADSQELVMRVLSGTMHRNN